MLLEVYTSGPVLTNCVLLACRRSKRAAIIDAPEGAGDLLIERIEELGYGLQMILLTHSHWDHIADVAYIKKKMGVPLYVHELDAENVRNPGTDGLPLMISVPKAIPDFALNDGDHLLLGELVLEVIHTPGHSPGGVCFYLKAQQALISGDTLFKGSIGRLDLPTSNPEAMWKSLEKLASLPSDTRVIPGHGEETTIGKESWLKNAKHYFGG